MDTLKKMAHVTKLLQYVQTLIGPQNKYYIKRLLRFTLFVCLFLCSAISFSAKGENELAKEEIRMIENSKAWTHVFRQYSNQAIPINIAPGSEDVLTIANIVVKSLHQDNYENFIPFLMEYDSDSAVWTAYYYKLDSRGNQQLGGGINIAIDAKNLQVLLVWYDE